MREHFLLDPTIVFLNHGSFGACPKEVLAHAQALELEIERNPVEFLGRRSAELLRRARGVLAEYLGADVDHLSFVPNATTGVNIVARSLPLAPGDEILTTDHEYGACDATWDFVCRTTGARVVRAEIPLPFRSERFTDEVWSRVTPRTRVLFLSHMTSTTALIFPIQELVRRARERGIFSVIDGAHVPGHLDVDLTALGADFYTGNCHKWLCAPKGAAFLHARPEHHGLLTPPVVSWGAFAELGQAGLDCLTGSTLLERRLLWQGTRDLRAFLSIPSAIAFQARHDFPSLRKRCHQRAAEALRRVVELTGLPPQCTDADFGQMVVLPVPAMDSDTLKNTLFDRYRIEIPVRPHKDQQLVRISVQAYNTDEDVERLLAALSEIYGLRKPA